MWLSGGLYVKCWIFQIWQMYIDKLKFYKCAIASWGFWEYVAKLKFEVVCQRYWNISSFWNAKTRLFSKNVFFSWFLFHFGSTYCRKLNVQSFYSIPNSRIEQCLFGGLKGKVNSKSVRDQKIMIQRYVEFFWDIYYNLNSRTMILWI